MESEERYGRRVESGDGGCGEGDCGGEEVFELVWSDRMRRRVCGEERDADECLCVALDYLATRPDHMGKGVASLLVQSGLEQADKVGLETIVMAKNASVGLYRRLGFALVKTVVQDDSMFGGNGAYTVHFMVRPVKGQMVVQREAETVGRA